MAVSYLFYKYLFPNANFSQISQNKAAVNAIHKVYIFTQWIPGRPERQRMPCKTRRIWGFLLRRRLAGPSVNSLRSNILPGLQLCSQKAPNSPIVLQGIRCRSGLCVKAVRINEEVSWLSGRMYFATTSLTIQQYVVAELVFRKARKLPHLFFPASKNSPGRPTIPLRR